MKKLILILALTCIGGFAHAYKTGDAPWCIINNAGDLQCFYYDLASCQRSLAVTMGPAQCVLNQGASGY